MPGWNLKKGEIKDGDVNEDQLWTIFNYLFSNNCRKRSSYKFGLIKSFLDNLFNSYRSEEGVYISYNSIFEKFAENYWNLIVKYDLRQMRPDGRSKLSAIERIFYDAVSQEQLLEKLEFIDIPEEPRRRLCRKIAKACKRNVVGALYEDTNGILYSFDLAGEGIILNPVVYDFMLKYKYEIEQLNYYAWAKFLEQVNSDYALVRVIDKLELATPRRNNLSVYRNILHQEFEQNTCFYCRRRLKSTMHVDHFIPWSFIKDDKLWNFVLACPSCNAKKNNRIPQESLLTKLQERNRNIVLMGKDIELVQRDFIGYDPMLLKRMWTYSKMTGMKSFSLVTTD